MDLATGLSILILVSCISNPVLLALSGWLGFLYFREKSRAGKEKARFESRIAVISRTGLNAVRETWLLEIQDPRYFSELEVELKFVYPMMRYLGYKATDLRMRIPVGVQVGRQNVTGISDWVVYRNDQPYIVIEAKEKNQNLNGAVKEQARSYCFSLKAPIYMLTNGRKIEVHRLGVGSDIMIFNSDIQDLADNWAELYKHIGVSELV